MAKTQIKVVYPSHSFNREVEAKPEGQKFGVGEEVYIRPMTERSMSHFKGDVITTVKHSYSQAFGDGGASSRYSTEIASWYNEDQLMPTNGRTLQECRDACKEYFGTEYQEMCDIHAKNTQEWIDWFTQSDN